MPKTFGERFKALRKQAGLTQEEVAKRLGLPRSAPVSTIEKPTPRVPLVKTIVRYAKVLGVPPSAMLKDVETDYDRLRAGVYDTQATADVIDLRKKKLGEAALPPRRRRRPAVGSFPSPRRRVSR